MKVQANCSFDAFPSRTCEQITPFCSHHRIYTDSRLLNLILCREQRKKWVGKCGLVSTMRLKPDKQHSVFQMHCAQLG